MLPAPLGQAQVKQTLDDLISKGKVVETSSGGVKISESTREELHDQLRIQNEREQDVQASFEAVFEDLKEQIEIKWVEFRDDLLYPLVSELGARTYELISGGPVKVGQSDSHLRFLDRVPVSLRGSVSDRIVVFLDARNRKVRGYVLRLLNAAFLVQATHLSDKTLEFVVARTGRPFGLTFSSIRIFCRLAESPVSTARPGG